MPFINYCKVSNPDIDLDKFDILWNELNETHTTVLSQTVSKNTNIMDKPQDLVHYINSL